MWAGQRRQKRSSFGTSHLMVIRSALYGFDSHPPSIACGVILWSIGLSRPFKSLVCKSSCTPELPRIENLASSLWLAMSHMSLWPSHRYLTMDILTRNSQPLTFLITRDS